MKTNLLSTLVLVAACALTTTRGAAEIADSTYASVNLTAAGSLSTVLKAQGYDLAKIKRIVVSGKINSRDFNTLGKTMVNLTDIDLSGTDATIIPDETFKDRQQLQTIKVPEALHKIGTSAFNNCYQLTSFNFTANLDTVGDNAFNYCNALKDSIRFSEKLSYLGYAAFSNCMALKQVDLSASTKLTTIGGMAFYYCTQLTSVLLPPSINYLEWGTFYYCSALVEMDLSGCTSLVGLNGGDTFAECRSLKRITLPPSLSSIGSEFRGCSALESFTMLASTPPTTSTTTFGDIPLSTCTLYVPFGSEEAYFNAPNWYFESIIGVGLRPSIGAHGLLKADGAFMANGKVLFNQQQAVLFEAIPEPGYEVDQFLVNGSAVQLTNNQYQLPAGVNSATIEVRFKVKQFLLSIQTEGQGVLVHKGQVLQTPVVLEVDSATSASFVVRPEAGFVIDSVLFNGLPCVVQQDSLFNAPKVTGNATLFVKFATASVVGTLYRFDVETGAHGSLVYKNTPLLPSTVVSIKAGESAQFTLIPDNSYILERLLLNGVDVTASVVNNMFMLEHVSSDASLSATFSINTVATVNVLVPGTLSAYFFKEQHSEITKLAISGFITTSDFYFIRDSLKNVRELDLQQADFEFEGIKMIPNYALSSHYKLSTILFPSDLCGIGENAFGNCSALTTIHLPATINTIRMQAFSGCEQLVSLRIDAMVPPTITNGLGGSITLVFVPNEAVSVYKNASGWNQYTILPATGTSVSVHVETAGTLSSLVSQQGVALTDVSRLVVTGTLNSEDFRVMSKTMTQLTAVDIAGTDVETIPNSAFEGKVSLLSFKAPSGIKTIGEKAFSGCRLLAEIPFGDQIVSIGNRAFENCASMAGSLKFQASLSSLGEYAFSNCAQLDTIDLSACLMLRSLSQSVFSYCKGVVFLVVHPELYGIGYQAFEGCASLKNVDLSRCKSMSMEYFAFGNCTTLQSISLPANIGQISSAVFSSCSQLKKILLYSRSVPLLPDNVFQGVDIATCELIVPTGSAKSYSLAPNWSSFAIIKEMGVLVNIGANGRATLGSETLEDGQVVFHNEAAKIFQVMPDPGYEVASFTVNGQNATLEDYRYQLAAGTQSAALAVTFRLKKFPLQVTVKGEGSLKYGYTLYKDTVFALSADSASTLVFSVLPSSGYAIDSVRFNGEPSVAQKSNTLYVTPLLTGPSELALQFVPETTLGTFHKMEVVTGKNGSVEYVHTPMMKDTTDVLIPSGDAAVFTYIPNQGYILDKVSYNGANVTAAVVDNQFVLSSVTAAGRIAVTFKVNPLLSLEVKTPGTLSQRITADQKMGVNNLTLTGNIDMNDFYYMRDSMEALSVVDLRQVTVGHQMGSQFYATYEIPNQAFSKDWSNGKKTLTEIFLPLNTRYIRDAAFVNCTNLQEAHIDDCTMLESIDYSAFNNTSLRNVSFPATLKSMNSSAFNNCLSLESVDLSKTGLTIIPENCFSSCGRLSDVKLPPNVMTISGWAFSGCSALTNIDLSSASKLVAINQSAFSNANMSSITFPATLKTIGEGAFQYCYALKTVNMSACTGLLNINASTFQYSAITSLTLPANLLSIGMSAFEGCNIIGTVTIPATVTAIGNNAFINNSKLTFCKTDATTPPVLGTMVFPSTMVAVFVQEQCIAAYEAAPGWEDYDIIGGERAVTVHVSKPGTLATSIMEQTGTPPRLVTTMVVTGDLNAVDFENMRTNMPLLHTLDVSGTDVMIIPEGAFKNKTILMTFKAPEFLVEIKPNAFENCSNLKDTLILPDGVITIGSSAFINCNSLTGIKLPKRLMTIGDRAFEGCNAINQPLIFSTKINSIGYQAFAGCSMLRDTLRLPYSLETLGESAFANCSSLAVVDLSECTTIKALPRSVFSGCTSLWKVVLPNTMTDLSESVFSGCSRLTTLNFPTNLVTIGNNAFEGCSSLVGIDLSKCVLLNSVGSGAFQSCLGLKTVNLSPVLMSIGSMAFGYNTALINISALNETPANLGDDVFYKVKTKRCVLSIPKASYNDYLNASQWGSFVQMSNLIDVVASTGGTVAFTSVDTAQVNPVSNAPMRVQRITSSPVHTNDPSAALVANGARICVLDNQAIKFYITPDEGTYIERVRYNGVDVTDQVVNGIFSSPSVSASMGSIEILFHNGIIGLEQTREAASQVTRVYVRDGIIHVSNEEAMQQVAVYDLKGTLFFKSNTPDRQYQCANLSSGLYIVRVLLHSGKVENVKVRL